MQKIFLYNANNAELLYGYFVASDFPALMRNTEGYVHLLFVFGFVVLLLPTNRKAEVDVERIDPPAMPIQDNTEHQSFVIKKNS